MNAVKAEKEESVQNQNQEESCQHDRLTQETHEQVPAALLL